MPGPVKSTVVAARLLVPAGQTGLDAPPALWGAMKRERESAPLWVWFTFFLMILGAATYIAGFWMVEELIAHIRK